MLLGSAATPRSFTCHPLHPGLLKPESPDGKGASSKVTAEWDSANIASCLSGATDRYLSLRLVPAPPKEMELFIRPKAQHVRRYKQRSHLTNLEPHAAQSGLWRMPADCSTGMTTLREVKGGATPTAGRQSGPGLDSSACLLQTQQLRPWEQQWSGKASSCQAAAPLKGDISPLGPTTHVGTCHSYPLAKTSEVFSAVQ